MAATITQLKHKRQPRPQRYRMLIAFPLDMLETLRQRSEENVRSINGEVLHLLKFALEKLPKPPGD